MLENETISNLYNGLSQVFKGKKEFLEKVIVGLIAGGHIIIEDMPGTGKTTIAKTLARLIKGASFKRIQFTPELLPYDITGMEVWDEGRRDFVFRAGPIFANIVLADEINRTTPKVQSALLEAMAESQVTVGNLTHPINNPFMVIATQNPIETEGTYTLPEAQKDRFMLLLRPGYPERETEYAIVSENPGQKTLPMLKSVCTLDELISVKEQAMGIYVDERLIHCVVDIAASLRTHTQVMVGVSTRGALMLIDAMKGLALVHQRDYVIDQDIADLSVDCFAHRIRLSSTSAEAAEIVSHVTHKQIRKIQHA